MAEITKPSGQAAKSSNVGSTLPPQPLQDRGIAYHDIQSNDACYVDSNGLIRKATGAANNQAARIVGYAHIAASANESVTLLHDVVMGGYSGLTPGTPLYLSGTVAGGLADAPSTGGTVPAAYVKSPTTIRVRATWGS